MTKSAEISGCPDALDDLGRFVSPVQCNDIDERSPVALLGGS